MQKPEARASALVTFNTSADKHVILMKTDLAAYGINLACASHIFFMEPVLDRTKEQQVPRMCFFIINKPPLRSADELSDISTKSSLTRGGKVGSHFLMRETQKE